MWKKAMTYLGLGDDEGYADYELESEVRTRPGSRPARPPGRDGRSGHDARDPRDGREPRDGAGRPPRDVQRGPRDTAPEVAGRGGSRPRPSAPDPISDPRPASGVGAVTPRSPSATPSRGPVRPVPVPVSARPHLVTPSSFNGVQEVADLFKNRSPVVMDLSNLDRDLSRRMIDFASGLCYALGGNLDRVGHGRYLLTPPDVTVSAEDRQRLGLS